MEFIEEDQIN